MFEFVKQIDGSEKESLLNGKVRRTENLMQIKFEEKNQLRFDKDSQNIIES